MSVSVHDRGFNYGDGVFETLLVCGGEPVWWEAHYARLRRGCDVLRIACPSSADLLAQAREFLASRSAVSVASSAPVERALVEPIAFIASELVASTAPVASELLDPSARVASGSVEPTAPVRGEPVEPGPRGRDSAGSPRTGAVSTGIPATSDAHRRTALKLVLTRGRGGRGYAPPRDAVPNLAWSLHAAPALQRDGIAVRWCELRLSQQPALAGLKHLNRLENVLARGEWDDPQIAEGLLRDAEGHVVCATAANLFVVREGRLLTPPIDRCGIAGVTRAWVMRHAPVAETRLAVQDIESADELFLTGSLRGILPVARLGAREWNVGPMTRRLQGMLHDEVSAL